MYSTEIFKLSFCLFFCFSFAINAQVGIGTTNPHTSSILDIESSNSGVLLPRIGLTSTLDIVTIANPEISLLVYNINTVNDVTPGFYYWSNSKWNKISVDSKIFGDIYRSSSSSTQSLNSNTPINFGSVAVSEGVICNSDNFQITVSGYYRVTYSVSVLKTAGSPINLGFYLAKSTNSSDIIEGSFAHTQVDELRDISLHMNKIVYLSSNEQIYLFPDITNGSVIIKSNAATMNIELIKAD